MSSTTASRNETVTGRACLLVALVATALVAAIVGAGVLLGSGGGPALNSCQQGQVEVGQVAGAAQCMNQP